MGVSLDAALQINYIALHAQSEVAVVGSMGNVARMPGVGRHERRSEVRRYPRFTCGNDRGERWGDEALRHWQLLGRDSG